MLSDEARLGGPAKFGVEQIVKMIAVACVFCLPVVVVRFPIGLQPRHANEVVQRGIVESISHRSVGRFLKASNLTTPRESPDKYGQPLGKSRDASQIICGVMGLSIFVYLLCNPIAIATGSTRNRQTGVSLSLLSMPYANCTYKHPAWRPVELTS